MRKQREDIRTSAFLVQNNLQDPSMSASFQFTNSAWVSVYYPHTCMSTHTFIMQESRLVARGYSK